MSKKRITPWIDESVIKEFDVLDGKLSENIEEAMQLYLQHELKGEGGKEVVKKKDNPHEAEALRIEIAHRDELIESKEDRIRDLQVQLGWLQMEYTKMVSMVPALPSPPPKKKKWWRFWRRKV